jgi:basic membrane protein A and related proteins
VAWAGVQKAATEMGFQAKFLESNQPSDYEMNIDVLATEGYNVIITVGSPMGDATALKARQYPDIKFAIIDNAYTISGLANVTSLMFAEDQVGFLAGVLAGGMSRSGFVCSVSSMRTPQSERYMLSFFAGATWQASPELRL